MGALKPAHIIVIILVIVLLFGAKKLPELARGLGRSMRIFKSEVDEMKGDEKDETSDDGDDTYVVNTKKSEPEQVEPIRVEPIRRNGSSDKKAE
jgi:TatA/E family protein of Tat protein translocase